MSGRGSETLLAVRDVHVAYGKVEAVRGISLRVDAGTIVSVIGPNGAGKTTLLAALMGLLPAKGELTYLGSRRSGTRISPRATRCSTVMPPARDPR